MELAKKSTENLAQISPLYKHLANGKVTQPFFAHLKTILPTINKMEVTGTK